MNKIVISFIFIIGIIVTGIILGKLGKPYNGILFNLHKLISVGTVIYLGYILFQHTKIQAMDKMTITLTIISIISLIILMISGSFMSIGKGNYTLIRIFHIITSTSFTVSTGVLLYFNFR